MALELMYITNDPQIATIAQKYGVDRIWVDLETLGKNKRQGNIDSVKSHHTVSDIKRIVPSLDKAKMLVRINPINLNSEEEIEEVIAAGADMIMLPMWKTIEEIRRFVQLVNFRIKTILLLETKEAVECLNDVLKMGGFDEIHIGLNDLHLSYGLTFMFELLSNGLLDRLCNKIKPFGIPYGFGGIARIGEGMLPAERIVMEHYRLGSTRAILSRSFCNTNVIKNIQELENVFKNNLEALRYFEDNLRYKTEEDFIENKELVKQDVQNIVNQLKGK